jgi:hypothetical protein
LSDLRIQLKLGIFPVPKGFSSPLHLICDIVRPESGFLLQQFNNKQEIRAIETENLILEMNL